jgi:hypothetical protein
MARYRCDNKMIGNKYGRMIRREYAMEHVTAICGTERGSKNRDLNSLELELKRTFMYNEKNKIL